MSVRSYANARRLDQRVRFERSTSSQDESGDPIVQWDPLVTCWAAVDGLAVSIRTAEPYKADVAISQSDYTVWIRADVFERYGIRVLDRIEWRGRFMNIKDIPDQQLRGRLIAVTANAGFNDG